MMAVVLVAALDWTGLDWVSLGDNGVFSGLG
jgi:hypothetical protein